MAAVETQARFLPHRAPARRRPGGFTLVELMVVIALTAILLALVVPSFGTLVAKMRVEGAANNLATDLQLARSEALQRRANVSLATTSDGTGYIITSGVVTIKSVSFAGGLSFTSGVAITFEPLRGLANAATVTSSNSLSSAQLRISTDLMGRVQFCTPDGLFKGYTPC